MQIILVSGLSGAGKSTALKILEDSGYYCVDNLPITMLEQLADIYQHYGYGNIAVGVDTRTSPLLDQFPKSIKALRKKSIDVRAIYLDATTECLVTRYSETRRKHPLSAGSRTVEECIDIERDLLADISLVAHRVDTTGLSANNLRRIIKDFVQVDFSQLNIIVQSFGFKYGLPIDADFVFDVRCLPNPHYDKAIREFNGTQQPIIDFLEKEPSVENMLADIYQMVSRWFDSFSQDNRNFPYKVITRHRQLIMNEQ